MKVAYFDLGQGISEERFLGGLLNLGIDLNELQEELNKLSWSQFNISPVKNLQSLRKKQGREIRFKLDLKLELKEQKIDYLEVEELVNDSELEVEIQSKGLAIIETLFATKEEILLPQAVKAIIFAFGILIGLKLLQIDKVYASSIRIGSLSKSTVLEMLKGFQITLVDHSRELITEIGTAIIVNLVNEFGKEPQMLLEKTGCGLENGKEGEEPELRIMIGEESELDTYQQDEIIELETNIDDMNQEFYDYIGAELLTMGALDVYLTPVQMKKNRPAQKLTVLTEERKLPQILEAIFVETTTLGVRINKRQRYKLNREILTVEVESKEIKVKLGYQDNRLLNIAPEYESCKQAAVESGLPLKEIYHRAIIEFKKQRNTQKLD